MKSFYFSAKILLSKWHPMTSISNVRPCVPQQNHISWKIRKFQFTEQFEMHLDFNNSINNCTRARALLSLRYILHTPHTFHSSSRKSGIHIITTYSTLFGISISRNYQRRKFWKLLGKAVIFLFINT